MSRSKRKTLIIGNAGGSEKKDKRICNRKLRRTAKVLLESDPDNYQDPKKSEMYNLWDMVKDGKSYFGDIYDKTSDLFRKLMRK